MCVHSHSLLGGKNSKIEFFTASELSFRVCSFGEEISSKNKLSFILMLFLVLMQSERASEDNDINIKHQRQ